MRTTDVWMCHLRSVSSSPYQPSPDDLHDAAAYTTPRLRSSFLVSRGILRSVLAEYAGIPAHRLRFGRGRHGKPYLCGRPVHFNISHSRDRLLIAVSRCGPTGVDIEYIRPLDAGWLAGNWFSRRERREWSRISPASRLDSFFHGWTRKEAFIKATGFGMAMPLDSFSVSLNPHRAELREVRGGPSRPWRLSRIDAGPECAAALVTFGDPGVIRIRKVA